MSECRSCGAPIFWCWTVDRPDKPARRIPLDPEPSPGGTFRLVHPPRSSRDRTPEAVVVANPDPGARLYRSHFATCPHAGLWRRE